MLAFLSTMAFCYASVGEFGTLQARPWLPFAHLSLHLTVNTIIWLSRFTLGFIRQMTVFWPKSVRAAARLSIIVVLPAPEGPTSMMPWRTRDVSYSWMHLLSQLGWGCKFLSTKTCNGKLVSHILTRQIWPITHRESKNLENVHSIYIVFDV